MCRFSKLGGGGQLPPWVGVLWGRPGTDTGLGKTRDTAESCLPCVIRLVDHSDRFRKLERQAKISLKRSGMNFYVLRTVLQGACFDGAKNRAVSVLLPFEESGLHFSERVGGCPLTSGPHVWVPTSAPAVCWKHFAWVLRWDPHTPGRRKSHKGEQTGAPRLPSQEAMERDRTPGLLYALSKRSPRSIKP